MTERLIHHFARGLEVSPAKPALWVNEEHLSYTQLAELASGIAASLQDDSTQGSQFTGILAHRSLPAYAGILGVLLAGKGYVPLNPKFPAKRCAAMIERSGLESVVLDVDQLDVFGPVLDAVTSPLCVVVLGQQDTGALEARFPNHRFVESTPLPIEEQRLTASGGPAEIAYLLFTSGSTGEPKGVPIQHSAVCHYVDNIISLYGPSPDDRFSQTFDLTFDLSVHDLFVAWGSGACLYILPERYVMAPAKFIRDHELTFWFSVPSTVAFMARFRMLRPDFFPSLKCSLFCGEALPVGSAARWQEAAPNSRIDNLYGPTEATIAFTTYRYEAGISESLAENGIMPIGDAMPGLYTAILDNAGSLVKDGVIGELALGGPQLSPGYWRDPEKTAERFLLNPNGHSPQRWYRTGDRARRDGQRGLVFLGRMDSQIKILGHRVEIGEIEHAVREASGSEDVCVIAWPLTSEGAGGVVAFIAGYEQATDALIERCRDVLPEYMVPKEIHTPERLPLNANGKVDRKALRADLEAAQEKANR